MEERKCTEIKYSLRDFFRILAENSDPPPETDKKVLEAFITWTNSDIGGEGAGLLN